jgi:hypothetical protein
VSARPRAVPLRAVAALFLERQHLDRPRRRRFTVANLTGFAADVGGIQIDSINVLERAHHLTLWSRFGPYDRARLETWIYRDRALFEYWAHAACFVPTTRYGIWRRAMLDYRSTYIVWGRWLKKHRNLKVVEEVEAAVRARGPLGNADFERPGNRKAGGWWSWKPATHALHYLWMSGRTAVHSRVHFQKRFDVAERVLPEALAQRVPDDAEFHRWHVRASLHAMGAATEQDLHGYMTFPRTKATQRRRTLQEMVRDGEVAEVLVENGGSPARNGRSVPWYALKEDLPVLAAAARRRAASKGTTFLAPFDSFLWHRERTSRLFGFDYRIEVYTPGHKRVHGYYTLPILHDGQLIGRMDGKNHRDARHLEVRHMHFEPWFAAGRTPPLAHWGDVDRDAALAGVAQALRSLAAFCGAERVTLGRVTPARLKAPLARALAAAAPVRAMATATESESEAEIGAEA